MAAYIHPLMCGIATVLNLGHILHVCDNVTLLTLKSWLFGSISQLCHLCRAALVKVPTNRTK